MNAIEAPNGVRGIDCNAVITDSIAEAIAQAGFDFVIRYIRRDPVNPQDLSTAELEVVQRRNLPFMVVQHVESADSWAPSGEKGTEYGETAVSECQRLGLPSGLTVWCDLEGVAEGTPAQDVIDYLRAWFAAVQGAGFEPGLYVGWHCGLTPQQLYAMPFARYWASYNLDKDEMPAIRGVCMRQHARQPSDPALGIDYQTDTLMVDALGGLPMWATV